MPGGVVVRGTVNSLNAYEGYNHLVTLCLPQLSLHVSLQQQSYNTNINKYEVVVF